MKQHASNIMLWRKAAVLGSLWAASEIVLGSFLKNARVPLAGMVLTGIGVAILVAGHRLWPVRGLLWRSGLICAAMKSVSPSAVLLSPMIAIFVEGLLAEAGVALLGANGAGYMLAGGLAMSWGLVHKIGKLLIFYGPDALAVYARGLEKLQAWLGQPAGVWGPVLLLLAAYFIAGMAAALLGLRAARKGAMLPCAPLDASFLKRNSGKVRSRQYSVYALLLHLLLVGGLMTAGRAVSVYLLAAAAAAYGVGCALLYARAARLLSRFGVWAGLLGGSVLAGVLLGDWAAGLRMAARAFALTMGFAAIGEELLNPVIRRSLERVAGKLFFETLEYAFSALPLVLSGLPSGKDMLLRPAAALRSAVARAPSLLAALEKTSVFIIAGGHGTGKSQLVSELAKLLRAAGKNPGGICAEGFWHKDVRAGFDLINLSDGTRTALCRRGAAGGAAAVGEFQFYAQGLAAGAAALAPANLASADAIFIDEIGFLELDGEGWARPLELLLTARACPLIIVVRTSLVAKVRARWGLSSAIVWESGQISAESAFAQLAALDCAHA